MYVSQLFQFPKNKIKIITHSNTKVVFLKFLKIEIHSPSSNNTLITSPNKAYTPTSPLCSIIIVLRILCQDKITYKIVVKTIITFDMSGLFLYTKIKLKIVKASISIHIPYTYFLFHYSLSFDTILTRVKSGENISLSLIKDNEGDEGEHIVAGVFKGVAFA